MGISNGSVAKEQLSLSSFARLSSSAEPKSLSRSEKTKMRKEQLGKELDAEDDITLSKDGRDKEDRSSRDRSLGIALSRLVSSLKVSGIQRGDSKALLRIEGRDSTKPRKDSLLSPLLYRLRKQVGKNFPLIDVPVEAVACVVTTGVDTIQLGNQGHPQ